MRAIVQSRYGDPGTVLELADVEPPVPGEGEVLVRIGATSVHADVWHAVAGRPILVRFMAGLFRPRDPIPGTDLAGWVEAVGSGVRRFAIGDAVFGVSQMELLWRNGGTFAELVAVPEAALAHKPDHVSIEEAAAIPTAGMIALLNLRGSAEVRPGHHLLINGAGGAVGTLALQVAKSRGATVTAVDRADKLPMLRSLGADHVIDYRQQDVTRGEQRYDLIFDIASTLALADCKRVLKRDGIYLIIGHDHYGAVGGPILGTLPHFFKHLALAPFDHHLPRMGKAPPLEPPQIMATLQTLLDSGDITPRIDRVYPLGQAVDAMRYLQSGDAMGRILLAPQGSAQIRANSYSHSRSSGRSRAATSPPSAAP